MVNRVCPSFYGTRQQDEGVLLLFLLTLLALAQGKHPHPFPLTTPHHHHCKILRSLESLLSTDTL